MTLISVVELAEDIKNFLAFKRTMGGDYRRGEFTLKSFLRAVEQRLASNEKAPLEQILTEWLLRIEGRKPVTVGIEFGVLRQLCLYRRRRDPTCFVPDSNWAPVKKTPTFIPYIFSQEEVRHLIVAAGQYHGRNISPSTLRMLLLLLYCTGMRLGEAVHLQLTDIDRRQQCFLVRESKGKTRILPFLDDLAVELSNYLLARQRVVDDTANVEPKALLLRESGQPFTVKVASEVIRRLLRQEGIKPAKGRVGPRPYEFRHAFAVHRLTAWYHQGLYIHAQLPLLSAYMGHNNVLGTQVYLAATPELMNLASQRFAEHYHRAAKE